MNVLRKGIGFTDYYLGGGEMKKNRLTRKQLKQRYVDAGLVDKSAKWYWDKKEKSWCLPAKDIVLSEEER